MKKLFMLAAFLVCVSCSFLVSEPQVKVKDLGLVGVGANGAELEFLLAVTNPNSFPLVLKGYTYDVSVMAMPLTKGGTRERIEFPAGETTDVRLPVRIAFKDLLEIMKREPDLNKIPYRFIGGLEVETPLGTSTVPVSKAGDFAVPERYRPSHFLKGLTNFMNGLRP
ncbi:MAG: hypothetical protein ED859_12915 [Desulfuromonadales bacterium]|nr:MAG: hypothetical protein ED859_12915 [Desulfuromonadales bacterium]